MTNLCESEIECPEHPRGRSLPRGKEEGADLWVGPCIMKRSLPDVEVREEGTSHRGNIVYKPSLPGGVQRGVVKKPWDLRA